MSAAEPRKASFAPVADKRTQLLICGSLPGDASLTAGRYYAHPRNQFWRLMSPVVAADLTVLDADARLATLTAAGVGLWDVIGSAHRSGSGDAAITDVAVNDVAGLAMTLPRLRAIAFNGGTAARIGRGLLTGSAWPMIALPSSSPLHTVGVAAKQSAWTDLRTWLSD